MDTNAQTPAPPWPGGRKGAPSRRGGVSGPRAAPPVAAGLAPPAALEEAPQSVSGAWLEGGYALLDAELRLLSVNSLLAQWLEAGEKELAGRLFPEVMAGKIPEWDVHWSKAVESGTAFGQWSFALGEGEGRRYFVLEWARPPAGWTIRLQSVLPPPRDLAETAWNEYLGSESARRNMVMRLLRAEAQLDNLTHRWPGVIFSQRTDFSFHFVSPQVEALTGVPCEEWEAQPNRFWQVVHEADQPELRQQIRRSLNNPAGVTSTYRIRHARTGQVAYLLEHRHAICSRGGLLLGYEGAWLDVTRQTIAERRLSTAAWKETLGVLTMGLAHDFSNIMAGIHSLSESFISQIESDHPFHEGLALIKKQSMQASQLVHRIIQLHHGKPGDRNYHNLNELMTDLVGLARKMVPRRIEVITELSPEPLPLYVDAFEFQQVLFNLTLNATDAMPHSGKLWFRTSRHLTHPPLAEVQGALPRLPAVCLEVRDTGCGIPARSLKTIFDPFFTTKGMNKGSGLGLYNARLFVEKHHGAISVVSTEGQGTCLGIWLPEADFTEAERSEPGDGRRRTLLVVGRAGELLRNTTESLRLNAYHVLNASTPEQVDDALNAGDYVIVGLYVLAEPTGWDWLALCHQARRLAPALKVILQVIGCNQDELDTRLLEQADLTVTHGMSQEDVVVRLKRLFGDCD